MTRVRRDGATGEPYLETRILLQPTGSDLLYGLGSRYFRDDPQEDDELATDRPDSLPESLTRSQILRIYRDEYSLWGSNNLPTWVDGITYDLRHEMIEKWLGELIVSAFPELEGML
jgi:hypothetical protein